MSLEPSMLQPALTLPFRLHGFAGKVTVRYGENRDPTRWGFDVLGLPFDIALAHGFPVCQADIAYDGSGYRAMMGWIQLVTVRDTHADAEDVSMDLLPIQTEADTPFCEFGQAPTFFDAPGPNPPRANEQWLASTFLAVCPDAARAPRLRLARLSLGLRPMRRPPHPLAAGAAYRIRLESAPALSPRELPHVAVCARLSSQFTRFRVKNYGKPWGALPPSPLILVRVRCEVPPLTPPTAPRVSTEYTSPLMRACRGNCHTDVTVAPPRVCSRPASTSSTSAWHPALHWCILPSPAVHRSRPVCLEERPGDRAMRSPIEAVAHRAIAAWSGSVVSRDLDLTVEGLAHLPRSGPVLIASRHFHHFYDGCILASRLPRPAHILVGLDWVRSGTQRRLIETACRIARWPVILRADRPRHDDAPFRQDEARGYLRRALTLGATLLREGETLVVFPEGYPNVDPVYTPKSDDDEFLPFRSGYLKIVELAQRWGAPPVAVVPAGLSYTHNARGKRWQVTMRLGPPDYLARRADLPRLARAIEAQVHALSSSSSSVPA